MHAIVLGYLIIAGKYIIVREKKTDFRGFKVFQQSDKDKIVFLTVNCDNYKTKLPFVRV